jgi:hypothetical protein
MALELPLIDNGVIKQGVVPEDEVEGEGRLPGMVDATNDLEIIG